MDLNIDLQLMVDSCTASLQVMFGEGNWLRWNKLQQNGQFESFQLLMTWLLDLGEQEVTNSLQLSDTSLSVQPPVQYQQDVPFPNTSRFGESSHHVKEKTITAASSDVGKYGEHQQQVETICLEDGAQTVAMYGDTVELVSKNTDSPFQCGQCSVSLSDIMIVTEHIKLRHPNSPVSLRCFCCQQVFTSTTDYINYHRQNMVMGSGTKPYVCDFCVQSFKRKQQLEDHIANKHEKLGPRYECGNCCKKFSHACTFNTHRKKCSILAIAANPVS